MAEKLSDPINVIGQAEKDALGQIEGKLADYEKPKQPDLSVAGENSESGKAASENEGLQENSQTGTEPKHKTVKQIVEEGKVRKAAAKAEAEEEAPQSSEQKETAGLEKKKERGEEAAKVMEEKIATCRSELEDARKQFLKTDYEKNTSIKRVRKFFGNIGKKEEEKGLENDLDIAFYRAIYDDKLFELQKLLTKDAEERGATDEELANLYTEFRTEQKITMASEHDNVKAEQLFENKAGRIGGWVLDKIKAYNKLPTKAKIARAGILFGAGLLVAAPTGIFGAGILAGTTAGYAIGVGLTGMRVFSGFATGLGTRLGLEARGQKKGKERIEAEKQEFLEKLNAFGKMNEEEKKVFLQNDKNKHYVLRDGDGFKSQEEKIKYMMLNEDIKNIAIFDEEDSLSKAKNQDIRQWATGVAVGTFIGSGAMSDFIKWGWHGVAEHFGWGGSHVTGAPKKTPFNYDAMKKDNFGGTPNPSDKNLPPVGGEAGAKPGSVLQPNETVGTIEHHEPVFDKNLTIEKGSSIEGSIIKQLKELGVENPGGKAHRMFLAYMEENRAAIESKVGKEEFQKMLKDGMVKVLPGTELHVVADAGKDGFSLREIHGSISHIEPRSDIIPSNETPLSPADVPSQEAPQEAPQETSQETPKANNVIEQRNDLTARILDNEGRLKALDLRQEALLRETSVGGVENVRPGAFDELLEVQKEIEQLREANRGLSSDLSEMNRAAESGTGVRAEEMQSSRASVPGESDTRIKNITPENNIAEHSGNSSMNQRIEKVGFERVFGSIENYNELSKSIGDMGVGNIEAVPKNLDSDTVRTINARNSMTLLKSIFGENVDAHKLAKELDKESISKVFASNKSTEEFLSKYNISGKNKDIFEKMMNAFNPKSVGNKNVHEWIARAAALVGRAKGMQ